MPGCASHPPKPWQARHINTIVYMTLSMRFTLFSWFYAYYVAHRLWVIALIVGTITESCLMYLSYSCEQSAVGLAGIICFAFQLPALPILLFAERSFLHAFPGFASAPASQSPAGFFVFPITPNFTDSAPFLIVLTTLTFIINALLIALLAFSIFRVVFSLVRTRRGAGSPTEQVGGPAERL
jgi:hypothetical protein